MLCECSYSSNSAALVPVRGDGRSWTIHHRTRIEQRRRATCGCVTCRICTWVSHRSNTHLWPWGKSPFGPRADGPRADTSFEVRRRGNLITWPWPTHVRYIQPPLTHRAPVSKKFPIYGIGCHLGCRQRLFESTPTCRCRYQGPQGILIWGYIGWTGG